MTRADYIRNINIPWPTKGMGDADYLLAFQHIVMPVAYQFDPDLVISRWSIAQCSARLPDVFQLPLDLTLQTETNWVAVSLHLHAMPT